MKSKVNRLFIGVFALVCLFSFNFKVYATDEVVDHKGDGSLYFDAVGDRKKLVGYISCTSSNENVAKQVGSSLLYSDPYIEAIGNGSATLNCQYNNGISYNFSVSVGFNSGGGSTSGGGAGRAKGCYACGNSQGGEYKWFNGGTVPSNCAKYSSATDQASCVALNNQSSSGSEATTITKSGCYRCAKSGYIYMYFNSGDKTYLPCTYYSNKDSSSCAALNSSYSTTSPVGNISGSGSLSITDEALVIDAPTKYTENGYCLDYIVKLDGSYSIANSITGVGTFKDYRSTAHCLDDTTTGYDTFCMDPAVIGPTSSGWNYTFDHYVDMNSDFGKALYVLYTEYYNGQFNNPNVNFEMTQAIRLLMAHYGESFLGSTNGPYKRHAQAYISAGLSGIAAQIVGKVSSGAVNPHTVNVGLNKLESSSDGSNYTAKFNLTLSGVGENASIGNDSLVVTATNESGASVNASISSVEWQQSSGTNRSAIVTVTGNASGSCTVNVQIGVKYNDPTDIKNIAIIRPTKKNMAQRMVVFFKGNIVSGDSASVGVSDTCNNNKNSACVPSTDFTCMNGESTAYVVEGTPTGSSTVNWESCIIGSSGNEATDPAGNSYTVQEQNRYCTVVCKEDYAFRFPGDLGRVAQGRYLSINVDNVYHAVTGVAAQRTCVTTEIGSAKYINEAVQLKREMLTQLNAYYYYKAMLEELEKDEVKNKYLDTHTSPVISYETSNASCNATQPTLSDVYDWYPEFKNVSFKYTKYKLDNTTSNLAILKAGIALDGAELSKTGTTGNAITGGTETGTVLENNEGPKSTDEVSGTYQTREPIVGACSPEEYDQDVDGCFRDTTASCTRWTVYEKALFNNSDDTKLAQYNATVERVRSAMQSAENAYESARSTLENYTHQINACTTWELDYEFDPEITFSYEEQSYIDMMQGNNKLQMVNKENVVANETKYYCTSNVSVESIVNCSTTPGANYTSTFVPTNNIDDPTDGDNMNFYNYTRIGVIDKYGDPGVSISGSTGGASFIYFKSMVPFYTYPNKGIVTTTDDGKNTTILDIDDPNRGSNETDGLVYPIAITTPTGVYNYTLTYKNIGQYYNSTGNLGRIMGDRGYLTGEAKNEYVCTYEVCNPFNDPDCPNKEPEANPTCQSIVSSQACNYGNIAQMSDSDYANSCISALLDKGCCDYIDESRVTISVADRYNEVCPKQNVCTGFDIVTTNGSSDSAIINDNGNLQFVVRSVSLNNLFPNGNKGVNWQTSAAEEVTNEIQSNGESVYAEAEYSYTLSPSCMAKIREYNQEQERNDLGFADYTLNVSNNGRDDNSTFLAQLEAAGCVVNKRK